MMKENIKSVGADATVRPSSKARQNKGITLIALVITIIVMLILVAVTISMAINGGLFEKASEAGTKTNAAVANEQILASGKVTIDNVLYNSIDEYINSGKEVNFEELFETATKHPDQTETDDIGIAEDGTIVNLDLWYYDLIGDNDEYRLSDNLGCKATGYKGDIVEPEGTIQGKVPMYIKEEGEDNFYPVTSMACTFVYNQELKIAPEIPSSVTDMYWTFYCCTSLAIPPELPDGVTDLGYTFFNCSSLTSAPEIPAGVENMKWTFTSCHKLSGTLKINANPTSYNSCLWTASSESGCTLVLDGPNQDVLTNLLGKASSNSNITIKQ